VTVVGDTHGQFHDVVRMMEVAGPPSANSLFIINGDMVDRGAWGLETLLLFCLYKLSLGSEGRSCVTLLRGNHETATCSIMYGFKQEVEAKYGKAAGKTVFSACKQLFKHLPLAALVNGQTLVLHGGLFRKRRGRKRAPKKAKRNGNKVAYPEDDDYFPEECEPVLGSLDDLRLGTKGGLDATGQGQSQLAADVLWSDPSREPGFEENYARGIGMVFGPEKTEEFLRNNGLKLVIRSHEGPDARENRPEMPHMLEGYTIDHETESGRLMTVFSAPDYPQHVPELRERYNNKASVLVLSAPDYTCPEVKQYEAVLPRPEVSPYYDLGVPDSDEEIELLPPTASGMTDQTTSIHIDIEEDEATTAF
jgi:serine/threonine-protein phosphatase 5